MNKPAGQMMLLVPLLELKVLDDDSSVGLD
jgi:hypothetical protein